MMVSWLLRLVKNWKATREELVRPLAGRDQSPAGKPANASKIRKASEDRPSALNENPAEKAERLRRLLEEKESRNERLLEELNGVRQQLCEERETAKTHILQVEIERNQIRSEVDRTSARWLEHESRARTLKAEREELAEKLAAKEREFDALRKYSDDALTQTQQEARGAQAQARSLEAALKQAEKRSNELQVELVGQKDAVKNRRAKGANARRDRKAQPEQATPSASASLAVRGAEPSPPNLADDFYRQAMTPLTVLLASADLIAANPQADASLRETTGEIKMQSKVLLDLIKNHASRREYPSNGTKAS